MTIPLAPIMGLLPMVNRGITAAMAGDLPTAMTHLTYDTIGVDGAGVFHGDKLISNILPLVAGLLVHKFVGGPPLNLNRILANAKIPFIRI